MATADVSNSQTSSSPYNTVCNERSVAHSVHASGAFTSGFTAQTVSTRRRSPKESLLDCPKRQRPHTQSVHLEKRTCARRMPVDSGTHETTTSTFRVLILSYRTAPCILPCGSVFRVSCRSVCLSCFSLSTIPKDGSHCAIQGVPAVSSRD